MKFLCYITEEEFKKHFASIEGFHYIDGKLCTTPVWVYNAHRSDQICNLGFSCGQPKLPQLEKDGYYGVYKEPEIPESYLKRRVILDFSYRSVFNTIGMVRNSCSEINL